MKEFKKDIPPSQMSEMQKFLQTLKSYAAWKIDIRNKEFVLSFGQLLNTPRISPIRGGLQLNIRTDMSVNQPKSTWLFNPSSEFKNDRSFEDEIFSSAFPHEDYHVGRKLSDLIAEQAIQEISIDFKTNELFVLFENGLILRVVPGAYTKGQGWEFVDQRAIPMSVLTVYKRIIFFQEPGLLEEIPIFYRNEKYIRMLEMLDEQM